MNRVEPNKNVYVGHRYVPLLVGEWDKSIQYEGLSIVTFKGASYTSKKMTPPGIDIENEEYWVLTGNYNAQVEYYRLETERVSDDLAQAKIDLNQRMNDTEEYVDTNVQDLTIYVNDEVRKNKDYVDGEVAELTGYVNDEVQQTKEYVDDELSEMTTYVNDEFTKNRQYIDQAFIVVEGLTKDEVVDNSVTINDAINSLPNGGTVFLPEGTYYIDTSKRIMMKSNITLHMHPKTILKAIPSDVGTTSDNKGSIIFINILDNVNIINGVLEGDSLNHSNDGENGNQWEHGIQINASSNVYLENIKSNNHLGDGFYISHSWLSSNVNDNIVVNNCSADGNNRNGFSLLAGKNIKIINPIATNQRGKEPGAGIDVEIEANVPVAKNIVIQNPTTRNNFAGITGRWDGCDGQDVSVTIDNHYDDSSAVAMSFYNHEIVNIDGEIRINNPIWINSKGNAFATRTYRTSNAKIGIYNPYIKNFNAGERTYLQEGACFHLTGAEDSECGGVGIYNPTIVDDREIKLGTTILHATDGGLFNKLDFENPHELAETSERPIFVSGRVNIKDERELLELISSYNIVNMNNSYLYSTLTNEKLGESYANITYNLDGNIPIGHEYEFKVAIDKQVIISPDVLIQPIMSDGTKISCSEKGSSIRIKKIDSTSWVVTNIIGTWIES